MEHARTAEGRLRTDIQRLRKAIRHHRDQKGDDRCWLDDFSVWSELGDAGDPKMLPTFAEGMARCREFFLHRRSDAADTAPTDANSDEKTWDADLDGMSVGGLHAAYVRLRDAIVAHRDVNGRPRTLADDRALYATLPERLPADFRLPPEEVFLGEERSDAGCPAFWRSHGACPCREHDLHRWGPCC